MTGGPKAVGARGQFRAGHGLSDVADGTEPGADGEGRAAPLALALGPDAAAVKLDRCRTMASPSPNPLWRRVVPMSACRKRSKTCGRNSGGDALPRVADGDLQLASPRGGRAPRRARPRA